MRDLYLGIAILFPAFCIVYYYHKIIIEACCLVVIKASGIVYHYRRLIIDKLTAFWYYLGVKGSREGFQDTSSEYYAHTTTLNPESNASCGRLSSVYQFVYKHYTESSALSEKIKDDGIHNCLSRSIDDINILKKHMETISTDEQADSALTNKELDDMFNNIQNIRTHILRNRIT